MSLSLQPKCWLVKRTLAHAADARRQTACMVCAVVLQETLAERKAARRAERDALARGEMPDSLKKWRVSEL